MSLRLFQQLLLTSALISVAYTQSASGQGLNTTASKDDWEEINFEFDSAVLVDGFPSLLKLAELLKANPAYRVKLTGHGDDRGSDRYNDKLAAERAKTVKGFLEKYGADPGRIQTDTAGKRRPKTSGRSPESRFMNRRVDMAVTDGQGRTVGSGSAGDAIRAFPGQAGAAGQPGAPGAAGQPGGARPADDAVLKRLDKLDDIANMLKDLKKENEDLKRELDNLKNAQQAARDAVTQLPKPLSANEVQTITDKSVEDVMARNRMPRFQLLGVNAGVDDVGNLTFTGSGRYFAPLNKNFAVQAQGEYLYFRDRKEGQFDLGMVHRYKDFQTGLFGSFKNVQFNDLQAGGTLGQGSVVFDYIFGRGKAGVFGTKAFLDNRLLARNAITRTIEIQTLLKAVDQVGAQATIGLHKDIYAEGNLGYLKSYGGADRPGGTLRFIFPINDQIAFTLEGGMNETFLGRGHNGRVVAGIRFGNWIRPKDYKAAAHPVPADVPRVRYELVTRRVRTGNDAPVADAGADQLGVAAGPITLDGSASYDPENDPITYQWTQIAGPAVSLSGASTSKASFTGEEGQNYGFRLTVTDDRGSSSSDRVNVTVSRNPRVRILRFQANPQTINAGQASTLTWAVENADEVVIDGIGPVSGSQTSVSPNMTTTYRLTARNRFGEASETATVTVIQPQARILLFTASPMSVNEGESTTLSWQTENADTVEITGVGGVAQNGSQSVTPTEDTTYLITARNRFNTATAQVAVRINKITEAPRIIRFSVTPGEIARGETALLLWQVENATNVNITNLGAVTQVDSREVSPFDTTRYVLTASNRAGETRAEVTLNVIPPVRIITFTANPPVSPRPGAPVVLSWTTEGAAEVVLDGVGAVSANGNSTVTPSLDTTYTLRATGRRGGQVLARVDVKVTQTQAPDGNPPIANAGPNQVTTNREIKLDGSQSFHPDGLVIGYSWRAIGRQPELMLGSDTATPTVRFANLAFGEYVFELTVTDSKGRFSRATTKVFFGAY